MHVRKKTRNWKSAFNLRYFPGLTSHQVDLLWSCLVEDVECSDDTLDWFVNQARNKDFHALDVLTFKYIFKNKVRTKFHFANFGGL